MSKNKSAYFSMSDGEELDGFLNFLDENGIEYDCTGTGDVDFDGNAENDIVVFADEEVISLVKNYLSSL